MASQKRSLSNAPEFDGRTKVPKLSQDEDSAPGTTAEDRFVIEVKLRSTSKSAENDHFRLDRAREAAEKPDEPGIGANQDAPAGVDPPNAPDEPSTTAESDMPASGNTS